MSFTLPPLPDTGPHWGPSSSTNEIDFFKDIPYAPFNKSDKLGKAADWTNTRQYSSRNPPIITTTFNVYDDEDEEDFQMVDTKSNVTQKRNARYRTYNRNQIRRGRMGQTGRSGGQQRSGRTTATTTSTTTMRPSRARNLRSNTSNLPASVDIQSEWGEPVKEIDFATLLKQTVTTLPRVDDLLQAGQIEAYNRSYSRITPKTERVLEKQWAEKRTFYTVTTSQDPLLNELRSSVSLALSSPSTTLTATMATDTTATAEQHTSLPSASLPHSVASSSLSSSSSSISTTATTTPPPATPIVVVATDMMIATLMASPRSVYSWDLIVTKSDQCLVLDKRDDSKLDLFTVNENSNDPPTDQDESMNTPSALSQEATVINQNFSQQVLEKAKPGKSSTNVVYKFPRAHPFVTEPASETPASVGYRYRKFTLDNITLLIRCEVDGFLGAEEEEKEKEKEKEREESRKSTGSSGQETTGSGAERGGESVPPLLIIHALHEYDPRISGDWRKRYEIQRGALLATEQKNNANRLARIAAQALLAGSQAVVLGFVSRVNPRDPHNHTIIGVQTFSTSDFLSQMNLQPTNLWGVVKYIVDVFVSLPNGKYLLFKDPTKAQLKIFRLPPNAFQQPVALEPQYAITTTSSTSTNAFVTLTNK
jgi:translation initiation factor 3 subunit D